MRTTIFLSCFLLLGALVLAPALAEGDEGQSLYNSKCAMCHGKDGVAKKMAAGSGNFNDPEWQKANSTEDIAATTAEGRGKMKGYAEKLTAEQIQQIADYVKTLQ